MVALITPKIALAQATVPITLVTNLVTILTITQETKLTTTAVTKASRQNPFE